MENNNYNDKLIESAKYFQKLSDERGLCPCGCGKQLVDHSYLNEVENKVNKAAIYVIKHVIDGEKESVFKTDSEFVHFVRQIAVENEDEELSITCVGEAKDYLENYCPNLELSIR